MRFQRWRQDRLLSCRRDIVDNTIRRFSTPARRRPTDMDRKGRPADRYIAPANTPACIEVYAGQCGGTSLILYGPHLTRFDISAGQEDPDHGSA